MCLVRATVRKNIELRAFCWGAKELLFVIGRSMKSDAYVLFYSQKHRLFFSVSHFLMNL